MVVSCKTVAFFVIVSAISVVPLDGLPTKPKSTIEDDLNGKHKILLQRKIDEKGVYRNPKVLSVDDSHQILNDYIDEIEDMNNAAAQNEPKQLLPVCVNQYGSPFPAFICPLMTILDTDYKIWRGEMPENLNRSVGNVMDLAMHPCDHNTSSCVVMALPENHILFGCVDDKTGKLVPPKNWNPNLKQDDENYVFDFRIPNPISIRKKCHSATDGMPICVRNNLFFKRKMIVQDVGCCCKGDFCADVLFDQSGFNPLPFIRVEVDLDPNSNRNKTPKAMFLNLLHDHKPNTDHPVSGRDDLHYNRFVIMAILSAFVVGVFAVCVVCLQFSTDAWSREADRDLVEDPLEIVHV